MRLKFSFVILSILIVSMVECSSMESIKPLIQKGLEEKKIEAVLARNVHEVTPKYDQLLVPLLSARDSAFGRLPHSSAKAKALALSSKQLICQILCDLWELRDLCLTLRCINAISFAKDSCSGFDTEASGASSSSLQLPVPRQSVSHNVFFKLCNQPFYHSRSLFGLAIAPEIIKLAYGQSPNTTTVSMEKLGYSDEVVHSKEEVQEMRGRGYIGTTSKPSKKVKEYKFSFPPFTVTVSNKLGGGQFGGIFIASDGKSKKKYFVKSYYGYPAKANLNSEAAFGYTTTSKMTSDITEDQFLEPAYEQVNLKELFTYKVLELIGLGPKVHFVVNSYLKDALFIVTEDLNTKTFDFVTMDKIDEGIVPYVNVELLNIRRGITQDSEIQTFSGLIGMLEIDTINRIFTLNDFNEGNFGYLSDKSIEFSSIQDYGKKWLQTRHEFKIVDFLPSVKADTGYFVPNIGETFLEGNEVTKYLVGSVMYSAIYRRVDKSELLFRGKKPEEMEDIKRKNEREKLFFGKQVIASLENRFNRNLENVLRDAQRAVVAFIDQNWKIIGLTEEYVKKQKDDIEIYIKGILTNYVTLRDFITKTK